MILRVLRLFVWYPNGFIVLPAHDIRARGSSEMVLDTNLHGHAYKGRERRYHAD